MAILWWCQANVFTWCSEKRIQKLNKQPQSQAVANPSDTKREEGEKTKLRLNHEQTNEQRHDKTNKVTVRPANTQINLGICRVFAVRMKKAWVLSYPLSAQRRHWSDWADAEADLSLRGVHSHFVGFVMSRLKWTRRIKTSSLFPRECCILSCVG